jgi:hypothetical protein
MKVEERDVRTRRSRCNEGRGGAGVEEKDGVVGNDKKERGGCRGYGQ